MYTEASLKSLLNEFLSRPCETELLEFKEARSGFENEKIGKYFSALSNEANLRIQPSAWLIFGVGDNRPRRIVGTNYHRDKGSLERLKHDVAKHTGGITFQDVHELLLPEGRVLMFQIPAAPAGLPTAWKGHYYGRDGESLVPLALHKIEQIRAKATREDWSAVTCPNATLQDLDDKALVLAQDRFTTKHRSTGMNVEMSKWDVATFLDKAKLTRNGHITRTAILLLGKAESSHHLTPHPAQITWKLDTSEERAYEHFGPPFLLAVERVFQKVRNVKFRLQPASQLIPFELTKYDQTILLEALNNCIAHQDYNCSERIILTEKVDRVVFQNAGDFFEGTVEDYVLSDRTPARYRNQFLAQAMFNLDMIDTMGMGIKRMFQEQRKRFFPMPDYDLSNPSCVMLTVFGKLINEDYSRILMEKENLELFDVVNLDRLQKGQPISKEAAAKLRKLGLVEGRYPNLFVSSEVADVTDAKAQYIKNRAFDDSHYMRMIMEFIDTYGFATREDVDSLIQSKLPEILSQNKKKNKVSNLLQKMRKGGLITNVGSLTSSKWIRSFR